MISFICQNLIKHNISISVAESFTGGGIASALTKQAGISKVFSCSVVAYSNNAKINILGVSSDIIDKFGAVSRQCAAAMAECMRRLAQTDIAVATTGFAGPPAGDENYPVGTYFVAIATRNGTIVEKYFCSGNREEVTQDGINSAFTLLKSIDIKDIKI